MSLLIKNGGPLMLVLLVLSVYGLAIVIERLVYFQRAKLDPMDLLCGIENLLSKGARGEALHQARRTPGLVARVAEAALEHAELEESALVEKTRLAAQALVRPIEKNLRGLLSVAVVSPCIGFLGTVIALTEYLIRSKAQPALLQSEYLSEALMKSLLTTGAGLAVAIPAYLFFMLLSSRARSAMAEMERSGLAVIAAIQSQRKQESNIRETQT